MTQRETQDRHFCLSERPRWQLLLLSGAFMAIAGCDNSNDAEPADPTVTPTTVQLPTTQIPTSQIPTDQIPTDQESSEDPSTDNPLQPVSPSQPVPVEPTDDSDDTDGGADNDESGAPSDESTADIDPDTPVIETDEESQPEEPDQTSDETTEDSPESSDDQTDENDLEDNPDITEPDTGDSVLEEPEPDTNPPVMELTPIDMLFEEIRLASGAALLQVAGRLSSGQTLDQAEEDCLGTFDPAHGEQPTQLECPQRIIVGESRLQLESMLFENSDSCQQAITNGTVDTCRLLKSSMLIPIEWVSTDASGTFATDLSSYESESTVALTDSAVPRIANIHPIAGVSFLFDRIDTDALILSSTSDITGSFECHISLSNAELLSSGNRGNCTQEIASALNRLYEMRQSTGVNSR